MEQWSSLTPAKGSQAPLWSLGNSACLVIGLRPDSAVAPLLEPMDPEGPMPPGASFPHTTEPTVPEGGCFPVRRALFRGREAPPGGTLACPPPPWCHRQQGQVEKQGRNRAGPRPHPGQP